MHRMCLSCRWRVPRAIATVHDDVDVSHGVSQWVSPEIFPAGYRMAAPGSVVKHLAQRCSAHP